MSEDFKTNQFRVVDSLPDWAKKPEEVEVEGGLVTEKSPQVQIQELQQGQPQTHSELPEWAKKPVATTAVQPQFGGSGVSAGLPEWARKPDGQVDVVPEVTSPKYFEGDYTPDDLAQNPKAMGVVNNLLRTYHGTSGLDNYTDQEKVDKFINTIRYLEAGNTVATIGFVDHVLSTDEEGRKAVADAYELFQGMSGGITDYTLEENFDRVKDYVTGAFVDPVNLIAPLVGKVFSQAGTTAASKVALQLARKEAARLSAAGASKTVQRVSANRVKAKAIQSATISAGKTPLYKEVMGATAFDTAVAVGTDIAYQHGLIEAGAQEDYSKLQTGLAALGGLVGGAVSAGVVTLRGSSQLPMANLVIPEVDVRNTKDLTGVFNSLTDSLNNMPDNEFREMFAEKVARGVELKDLDTEFWGKMLLGEPEEGFKGLAPILYDNGFRWLGARETGDNVTNWLADVINFAPDKEVSDFVSTLKTKLQMPEDMPNPTRGELADNLSKKMSQSGWALNRMSQVAGILKFKTAKDVTIDDYMAHLFGDTISDAIAFKNGDTVIHKKFGKGNIVSHDGGKLSVKFSDGKVHKVGVGSVEAPKTVTQKVAGALGGGVSWGQDTYIRLLVTHPGTSALNVIGWSYKSAGQSAADLLHGTFIYGGGSLKNLATGNLDKAKVNFKQFTGVYAANLRKLTNLIDPFTTADSFNSIVDSNPDIFKELVGVGPGGIPRPVMDLLGVEDTTQPMYQRATEKYFVEPLQTVGLVKAHDVFTKSQEFMYNFDIGLRKNFGGRGYRELMSNPAINKISSSPQWQRAHSEAVQKSVSNIMSSSVKKHPTPAIRQIGGFIEDFRSIPVIGATIPFGRFFNNVVSTISEYSGGSLILKAAGTNIAKDTDAWELAAKTAVGWTAAFSLVDREIDLLNRGIAWDEDVQESTGQGFSERYNAPFIAVKAASRWLAYKELEQEVPEAFLVDARDAVLGQLTRQLSESGDAFGETVLALLNGDNEGAVISLRETFKGLTSTVTSGATRFMEPVNALVALGQPASEYMAVDVRTGNAGFAKAFRYIDQLIPSSVTGDTLAAVSPTREYVGRQPTRLMGVRPTGPQTSTTRVFAMVGRPSWDADFFADDKVAQNILVSEFGPILEVYSKRLEENPVFLNGNLQVKDKMLNNALEQARETTHKLLQASTDPDNPRLSAIFKLTQNNKVNQLERYMEELGLEEESLHELTTRQLEVLKYFVDNDDEFNVQEGYRQLRGSK